MTPISQGETSEKNRFIQAEVEAIIRAAPRENRNHVMGRVYARSNIL
ncbi:hypothetical protein JCM14722_04810 [Pseudodesulfovibrio portus]|uniref:Uncharacterized protein n=1 Tax=Pseudodesulfovibrio portus TaxID=231439 RepID=A0ABM8ANP4_9BACT|nr:hypothetical protein JCM14722_04810 [Pseudodesulfovibrio portus]